VSLVRLALNTFRMVIYCVCYLLTSLNKLNDDDDDDNVPIQ